MSSEQSVIVTVAMPLFNAGNQLRLALCSIIKQSFQHWELLLIDDGSTDGSLDAIADIVDPRIHILRDGLNKGLAARLNEAIQLARGRYFARMDQDDVSYPERLACQLELLEQDPELDLVALRCIAINEEGELVGILPGELVHKDICARPWIGFHMPHPTWMGRIEWFRRYCYASPGPYFCEDQELLLRSYRESRFASIPEILFAYRVRDRVNWRKLIKTRKTLLGLQLRQFVAARQLSFAGMAAATFVARVTMDGLGALVRACGGSGLQRYHAMAPGVEELRRWRDVSNHLAAAATRFE
jgi:glycosyltransferase involved in cell wall biosynthesis